MQIGNTRQVTLVDLFNEQAVCHPQAIAVRFGDISITYNELNERANQLAHHLRCHGVGAETMVPIFLDHGIEIIIAVLGIWKAGGAYVPIDPEYPTERVAYMLNDVACKVVISNNSCQSLLPKGNYRTLCISQANGSDIELIHAPVALPLSHHLAYVIYTSGSTGNPKGVMVEHDQIYQYTIGVYERFTLHECNSYAMLGTFSADAGHTAIFASLCFGKVLTIINVKKISSIDLLVEQFKKHPIDCYKATPSLMSLFLQSRSTQDLLPRKRMILGGEACAWTIANDLFKKLPAGCKLLNHYGPTETTVGNITFQFPDDITDFPKSIPLGKPLKNVGLFILSETGDVSLPGDSGELYIEGPLVARGYLNNDALTNQKFVTLNLLGQDRRLYKTGDIVRQLTNGDIEYLGRNDDQVKISGNRIELKEIENAVLQTQMVEQCVVTVREHGTGAKYLAGYITPRNSFDQNKLIAALKRKLAHYMIPVTWTYIHEWPLTFNNKIDRKALPPPKKSVPLNITRQEAATTEQKLIRLWKQLLGTQDFRVQHDFFESGGDSLQLIKLSFEIQDHFGIDVSAVELFGHLTVGKMVQFINGKINNRYSLSSKNILSEFDEYSASAAQRNLFVQYKLNPSESFPNSSITFELFAAINHKKLEKAFQEVIQLHESIRTTFRLDKGKLYKVINTDFSFAINHIHAPHNDIDKEIMAVTKPFDFRIIPLMRVFLIQLEDGRKYLHLDMPHINSDGESTKIIMDDLEAFYNNTNKKSKRLQFTDFQKRMHLYEHSEAYTLDEQFWKERLSKDIPSLDFGPIKANSNSSKFAGVHYITEFHDTLPSLIANASARNGLTRFQLLLCAYIILLYKKTSVTDQVVMTPVLNRNEKDLESIVGLLTNVVLIRTVINPEQTLKEFVDTCKRDIVSSMRHQTYSFEKILDLWSAKGRANQGLLQSFFGYHINRKEYRLDSTTLHLYMPLRDKENLPLSMAVFETEGDMTLRISSAAGVFQKQQLMELAQDYLAILRAILLSNENETIATLLRLEQTKINHQPVT